MPITSTTPNSTGPSTSAILFYQSSRRRPTPSLKSAPSCFSLSNHLLRHSHFYQSSLRHRRHVLLLPILTAAAYLRAILFFTLQPLPKRRARFMPITSTIANSTGPHIASLTHPPSCSSRRHNRNFLLPILTAATPPPSSNTAAAYLRDILFFPFQSRLT